MFLALCEIYKCNNVLEVFSNIEVDYSVPDDSEWELIEKYRDLDDHGREMVDFTLLKEWERSVVSRNEQVTPFPGSDLKAAHALNPTAEQKAAADRIMEDDNEWK